MRLWKNHLRLKNSSLDSLNPYFNQDWRLHGHIPHRIGRINNISSAFKCDYSLVAFWNATDMLIQFKCVEKGFNASNFGIAIQVNVSVSCHLFFFFILSNFHDIFYFFAFSFHLVPKHVAINKIVAATMFLNKQEHNPLKQQSKSAQREALKRAKRARIKRE